MDLLSTDDQNWSASALTGNQAVDSDKVSELLSGIETVSELSDPKDKSTLNVSSQDLDSDSFNSLTPSCSTSRCFSISSEASPKDDGFRISGRLDSPESTLPILPQFSHDFISPQSTFTESLSFSLIQATTTSESSGSVSSRPEGLKESSDTGSENSPHTPLFRSSSDSLDCDTVVGPMSDLYIFESGTNDFTLSQTVNLQEITCPEYLPLSQAGVEKANLDTHVLVSNSAGIVSQCHCGSSEELETENDVSEVSQHKELRAPAVDASGVNSTSVDDVGSGISEVTDLTLQVRRSNSPIEVWLDACQYLTDEDAEDWEFLDKTGHSVIQGGHSDFSVSSFPAGETNVSDYNPIGSKGIGWSSDDTRGCGPPVERWPSVDSWATALSDWTGIIEASPEDFTTAFAEIGAEIDALTQALEEVNTNTESDTLQGEIETTVEEQSQQTMGVQDQPLKTQNISESSIHAEQSRLSLCLEAAESEVHDGGSQWAECLYDSAPTTQREQEPEELQSCQAECSTCPTIQPSTTGPSCTTVISSGIYSVDEGEIPLTAGSTSSGDQDLPQFGGYIKFLETDIFGHNEGDQIVLNITEDTDLNTPAELTFEKPFGDVLCQVTDERRSPQLDSVAPQQRDCEGNKSSDLSFLTRHPVTKSDVQGVCTQPDVQAHVWSDTLTGLDGALPVEPQFGSPEFIMPLAPLCSSTSFLYRTNSNLDRDQTSTERTFNDSLSCHHIPRSTLCPTTDGITDKPFLEGREELIHKKQNTINSAEKYSPEGLQDVHTAGTAECFLPAGETSAEEISDLSGQLGNFTFVTADNLVISQESRVVYVTLDLDNPFVSSSARSAAKAPKSDKRELKMPHKTHKHPSEGKTRSKKEKSGGHHHGAQISKKPESVPHPPQHTCKQQESHATAGENYTGENSPSGLEANEAKQVTETAVRNEKSASKSHGKKKKKHGQNATAKSGGESSIDVEHGAKPKTAKGKIDMFEAKLGAKAGKAHKDGDQSVNTEKKTQRPEAKAPQGEEAHHHRNQKDHQSKNLASALDDDAIKRRRLTGDKFGKIISNLESNLPKTDALIKTKGEETQPDVEAARKKAYSEVVKQKIPPKEDLKVLQPIQAESVSGDPQGLCLWCQFATGPSDYTATWSIEGAVLAETKKSAGDESRVSLIITNASHKDLGKYQCRLSSSHGSVTLDYLLTYEAEPEEVCSEEEDVHCSKLLFKEDFLSDQSFGERHPLSILTEKVHFGEGMHRRAFRTKLQAGQISLLVQGHSCVLKVHNAISYGTKNNDELIQKNFILAVEECHVQNTAREYIKAYTAAAQSVQAFGDVPEIIPIYLVHRPSNDIPYATLEEELIGDFVKYSVKDGKEINLMRRDSEAGQKCCAFQHWVYQKTEGNLLVTDMQGVGMRLTDVGIATCKKGYKGFKGNCSTSFIDQFKALHQCNKYCEILGLTSIQPKAKKPAAPKPKPQPSAAPKKKTFGPTVKGKS